MVLNQGGSDNGAPIAAHYTTAWFDKGEPERNMTCPFLEMWLRASGVKLSYVATWDYGDLVDAQNIDYGDESGVWGQNASDVDANVKWWGPGEVLTNVTKPTAHDITVMGTSTVTNPGFAYDFVPPDDRTTSASISAVAVGDGTTYEASLVLRDFASVPVQDYTAKTLKVNLDVNTLMDNDALYPSFSVDYSLDAGTTWYNLAVLFAPQSLLATYSVVMPASQDISLVRVRGIARANSNLQDVTWSSIEGVISDVWIEADYNGDGTTKPEGVWQDTNFKRVRVDIYGIGRVVQFTFQMNGSGEAEILAYRPDLRSKGLL
jgi:hypothetical protein